MEELFKKYVDNQCSPDEVKTLMAYFHSPENESQLRSLVFDVLDKGDDDDDENQWQGATDRILVSIKQQIQPAPRKVVPLYRRNWIRIAAVLVLALGIFFIYNYRNESSNSAPDIADAKVGIVPGSNKATLTLADGSNINLATLVSDRIARQGSTDIVRVADGQLSYNLVNEKSTNSLYNTITTPKGGQYQLTLSDGTKIWLNAASSIHYPVAFTGNERNVEVTGEVYFEVTKNTSMPFKVKIDNKAEVEVLGTHFNVNAYSDEASVNTTLLEGKVKVTGLAQKDSRIISPGEQAQINANNQISVVKQPDAEQTVAWKNGIFSFYHSDLATTLRQIGRWYDVDIVFEGAIPSKKFSGEMQRNLSFGQLLKLLEKNGVYGRQEGRKLIIANK